MKKNAIICCSLLCLSLTTCFSQGTPQPVASNISNKLKLTSKTDPLSPYSFDRYVLNAYSFALLGSQAPTTGIKFETAKPKITLSGVLYLSPSKKNIFSMELTGGIKESAMELFSSNKTSGQFTANVTYNRHIGRSRAGHLAGKKVQNELWLDTGERELIIQETEQLVRESVLLLALVDPLFLSQGDLAALKQVYGANKDNQGVAFDHLERDKTILSMLKKYGTVETDLVTGLKNFQMRLKNRAGTSPDTNYIHPKQLVLLKKNLALAKLQLTTALEIASDREIAAFKSRYTYTDIFWFSFSPSISNTSYQQYERPIDTAKQGTLTARNLFEWRAKFALNYLKKPSAANKFLYLSFAFVPGLTGSLAEMKAFSYKSTEQYKVASASITAEETGTAYIGRSSRAWGFETYGEAYYVFAGPRFVPGLYAKLGFSHNTTWTNPNQVPLELGLVFNLPSSAKDPVNLLSIIPYGSWTNLMRSKDPLELTKSIPLHDKFFAGVKVGVPINIGK